MTITIKLQSYTFLTTGSVKLIASALVGNILTITTKENKHMKKETHQGDKNNLKKGLEIHQIYICPIFISAGKYIVSRRKSNFHILRN